MTRMERRRMRTRRRLIQAFIGVVVITATVMVCASFSKSEEASAPPGSDVLPVAQAVASEEIRYEIITLSSVPPVLEIPNEPAEVEIEDPVELPYTEKDVIAMAQMAYGEAFVTQSDTEMSACMWVVCNRLDSGNPFYAGRETIYEIITQNSQFHGYDPENPIDEHLVWLARDVLNRWAAEKNGATDVGRTLPAEYTFFHGTGLENLFRKEYEHTGEYWDWSLPSPYDN